MNAIDKIKARYNAFKANENDFWLNRFTYKRDMKQAMPNVDLVHFGAETQEFINIKKENSISGFLKLIEVLSDKYILWAKNKDNSITDEESIKMKNWFKGALGEYFFFSALEEIKCFYISPDASNQVMRFQFGSVAPIEERNDNGIDFVAIVNDIPSVIQVKTYHDFNKVAKMSWYLKAYGDGCANDYINQHDKWNTFLCWFGTEKNGLMSIRNNKGFDDKALCLGYAALFETIDKKNMLFWDKFYESLGNIG